MDAPDAMLTPTPSCEEGPTPPQIEGPFFTPSSPERTSLLEPDLPGARFVLEGRVVSTSCQPIAGALVDLWHADAAGVYDNVGFRLRGHQFTDAEGRYRFETIIPGEYMGRTRHFHVKVQAPGQPVLTTQLYFPGEARNCTDAYFDPALLMRMDEQASLGTFEFVLEL